MVGCDLSNEQSEPNAITIFLLCFLNVLEFARVLEIQGIHEVLDSYLHLESGGYIHGGGPEDQHPSVATI